MLTISCCIVLRLRSFLWMWPDYILIAPFRDLESLLIKQNHFTGCSESAITRHSFDVFRRSINEG